MIHDTLNKMSQKKNLVYKIEGEWWKMNSTRLPMLAKLAKRLLSAPSSSVESERLFSIGGNIYTPKRNRLTAEHGEMLMFLYFNLRAFDFKY